MEFQQSLSSGQKTTHFCRYWQILVKNRCRYIAGDIKAFYIIFCFDFLHIDPSNDFCFCMFFAKGLKREGERLKVKFFMVPSAVPSNKQKRWKNLESYYFVAFFWLLSVKTDVSVPLKSSKQENFEKILLLATF